MFGRCRPARLTVLLTALLGVVALIPSAGAADTRSVAYRVEFVNDFGCHIVQVNLADPNVKVTPILSLRSPGGAESMLSICSREQPAAAITGTFFSKTTLLPIGDIVVDGRLVYFGGMGSALAITPDNRVAFERVPYGRHQDWSPFETVLACGPTLLEAGEVALAPRHERFRDPRVLGRARRSAVGLTPQNKLLLVATREVVSLWELAKIMRDLGCIDAINLDGGSSTGLYYRGSMVIRPARSLVNMLAVYEDVPRESRTCYSELPTERTAIYRYRAARAYEAYMRAQTPLAEGDLDTAIRLLDRACELDHLNASYQTRLAQTLVQAGETQAASVAWAKAGEILMDKCLYEEALERYRTALRHDATNILAQEGLPAAYRALGMEAEAESIEAGFVLNTLQRTIVAAHTDLMAEMAAQAFALAGQRPSAALTDIPLESVSGGRYWIDAENGLRLSLPEGWHFRPSSGGSQLFARHRSLPGLAHLRAVRVPQSVSLERLVNLYFEGSFQQQLVQTPVFGSPVGNGIRTTETITTTRGFYIETLFARRGATLFVLTRATPVGHRDALADDFCSIAASFEIL